jgi:hypothetical protein
MNKLTTKRIFKLSTLLLISAVFLNLFITAQAGELTLNSEEKETINSKLNEFQSYFYENQGELDFRTKYFSNIKNGILHVEKDGTLTYSFLNDEKLFKVKENFVTNTPLRPMAEDNDSVKINNLNCKTDLYAYKQIILGEPYKGIHVKLRPNSSNNIEKLITVNPGADPSGINIALEGTDQIRLNNMGEIEISASGENLTMSSPKAYQEINGNRREIEISYNISGKNTYGFNVGEYNNDYPLIIDPILYSTYVGANDPDNEWTSEAARSSRHMVIATDPQDNNEYVYVTGYTQTHSCAFPYSQFGVMIPEKDNESIDVFVAKLPLDLSEISAGVIIGGSDADTYSTITADSSGNIYVAMETTSDDIEISENAYQKELADNFDIGIYKLNPALDTALASTYVGGTGMDSPHHMAYSNGKLYITGVTENFTMGNSFPVGPTEGDNEVYDHTPGTSSTENTYEIFIARLDNNLSNLEAATFIKTHTYAPSIAILSTDANSDNDKIIVTGITENEIEIANPTDPALAYQQEFRGNSGNFFAARFNSKLTNMEASTHFGETESTFGTSTSVAAYNSDDGARIIITGDMENAKDFFSNLRTDENNTRNDYDEIANNDVINSCEDENKSIFIANLNYNLEEAHTAVICGAKADYAPRITVDPSNGDIYITATTQSSNYPVTLNAYQNNLHYINPENPHFETVISKFPNDLSTITSSTYLGGVDENNLFSNDMYAFGLDFDASSNLYIAGQTLSQDFPTSPFSVKPSKSGADSDFFITGLTNDLSSPCAPLRKNYSDNPPNPPTAGDTCVGIDINAGPAYIEHVPDSFSFPEKFSTLIDQNSLSNFNPATGTVELGPEDIITVTDLRGDGAFDLTVHSSAFTNGYDEIPLSNFYIATSVPEAPDLNILESGNALSGTIDSKENIIYADGVSKQSQNITSGTGTNRNLDLVKTYTELQQSFDKGIISIMEAQQGIHYLRASQALSFYLQIPENQPAGTYSALITFDLILS